MADRIAAGEHADLARPSTASWPTDEADDYVAEEDFDEFDEEDDDDGQGGSKALTKKLEELKKQALEKFAHAARALRQDAQGLREGRLQVERLQPGPARHQRRPDDDPLHGQDDREAVPHPALPGRRRAPLRARDPQDRGRQVRHAAGPLHPDLPAQRDEPEVGREGNRRSASRYSHVLARNLPAVQELQQQADRPAEPRRGAAGRPEADQQEDERGREGQPRRQEGNDRGQPAPGDLASRRSTPTAACSSST